MPRPSFDDVIDYAKTGESPTNGARPHGYSPPRPFTAAELQIMVLPDIRYIIPGILPEGLCVLAGKPKLGKSWLAMGVSVAVATGGYALGTIQVQQGEVLYLALEDNPRRLKKRLALMLPGADDWPASLHMQTEWPRLNAASVAHIGAWLDGHPNTRLVVIDTLAKIRPKREGKNGAGYSEDYDDIEQLQLLAAKYQVAILLIHHARKLTADDWLDEISGTLGIAGSADGAMLLKRARGEGVATLAITGRDLEEDSDLALLWDAAICNWREIGTAADLRLSKERQEILDLVRAEPGGMSPLSVAHDLKKNPGAVRKLMADMLADGQLFSTRVGVYMAPAVDTPRKSGNTGNAVTPHVAVMPVPGGEARGGVTDTPVRGVTGVTQNDDYSDVPF